MILLFLDPCDIDSAVERRYLKNRSYASLVLSRCPRDDRFYDKHLPYGWMLLQVQVAFEG